VRRVIPLNQASIRQPVPLPPRRKRKQPLLHLSEVLQVLLTLTTTNQTGTGTTDVRDETKRREMNETEAKDDDHRDHHPREAMTVAMTETVTTATVHHHHMVLTTVQVITAMTVPTVCLGKLGVGEMAKKPIKSFYLRFLMQRLSGPGALQLEQTS
jgi:hypothetical protein